MSTIYISFGDPNDGNIVPLESIHQEKIEMAKIELNTMVNAIRGQVDKAVFKKHRGKTILSKQYLNENEPTEAQAAHQLRFKKAVRYGRRAMEDTALRSKYELAAEKQEMSIFAVCVADFFNPPTIVAIDLGAFQWQAGDLIQVETMDDFSVAKVTVALINADTNELLETGMAFETSPGSDLWTYTVKAAWAGIPINVQVTAVDHPGNVAVQSAIKPLLAA